MGRKGGVDFPTEARGWIAPHCAGLSEEQKAIVKAKTRKKMDLDSVSAGIRSYFPTFEKASGSRARKPTAVLVANRLQVRRALCSL